MAKKDFFNVDNSEEENTFTKAAEKGEKDKQIKEEHAELKAQAEALEKFKKGGRPLLGKSHATHTIKFKVDDEQLEWLEKKVNRKLRTPHAVAKLLFKHFYDLENPSEK
ncbi:MAG: hypothetical protein OIF32_11340 [Campylobacterales bacterium]|nr:hypothetical protein [Campylobacterales bacterium]